MYEDLNKQCTHPQDRDLISSSIYSVLLVSLGGVVSYKVGV